MIKEKELMITMFANNITYFRNKGYVCKFGEDTLVKIEDLNPKSHIKITGICEVEGCNKEVYLPYYKYLKNKNCCGYYGCKSCSYLKKEVLSEERHGKGITNPSQLQIVKDKKANTQEERTGFRCNFSNPSYRERMNDEREKRTGYREPLSNPVIRAKGTETIKRIFGVNSYSNTKQFKDMMKDFHKENRYQFFLDKGIYFRLTDNNTIILKCDKHNHEYETTLKIYNHRTNFTHIEPCTICNPIDNNTVSNPEKEIVGYIKSIYNGVIIQSDKTILKPKEIDIYLPAINLAFEFNGVFWHSVKMKPKNYHIGKYLGCRDKNVDLYQIWEDDWWYKEDIIKNEIYKLIVNKIDRKKYVAKNVENKDIVANFINTYNINGYKECDINIGVYYKKDLVSLMCFNKNRNKSYEIVSHTSKYIINKSIIIDYFINIYNLNVLYLDFNLEYGNYGDYIQMGFEEVSFISPIKKIHGKCECWNSGYIKLLYSRH